MSSRGYAPQNARLVADCNSSDGLAAVFASCTPMGFQGLEEAIVNCHKRPLYPVFEHCEEPIDEDICDETANHQAEKKRRLTMEQVKSLEKNFELENKLEPDRKIQLARELGLQPRQVAVWFQNRRARWKTKQLEKDYETLKSEYDDLKNNYSDLIKEKDRLHTEVIRLRERLGPSDFGVCEGTSGTRDCGKTTRVKIEEGCEAAVAAENILGEFEQDLRMHSAEAAHIICKNEGSLSSDSDASEVLEVDESPSGLRFDTSSSNATAPVPAPLAGAPPSISLVYGNSTDPTSVAAAAAAAAAMLDDPYCNVFLPPHVYQRSTMKVEEVEEDHVVGVNCHYTLEDQGWLDWA